MHIRLASEADAPAILGIYAPFVRGTAITFEESVPGLAEFAGRVCDTLAYAPWLVLEDGNAIQGYAYGSKFRPRAAYRWTIETTVYIRPEGQGRGLGRALYTALLGCLTAQGFASATGGVALPNDASIRLHDWAGFERVGTFRAAGFKLGAWRDVLWFQKMLRPSDPEPAETLPTDRAAALAEWRSAIEAGEALLRR
jgi:phosphinothricin acetyltransferase